MAFCESAQYGTCAHALLSSAEQGCCQLVRVVARVAAGAAAAAVMRRQLLQLHCMWHAGGVGATSPMVFAALLISKLMSLGQVSNIAVYGWLPRR